MICNNSFLRCRLNCQQRSLASLYSFWNQQAKALETFVKSAFTRRVRELVRSEVEAAKRAYDGLLEQQEVAQLDEVHSTHELSVLKSFYDIEVPSDVIFDGQIA